MAPLPNSKHERFAQALAKGKTADEAASDAGLIFKSCAKASTFYVYFLIDPRNNSVFYVGKGTRKRAFQHLWEWRSGTIINAPKFARIGEIEMTGFRVRPICVVDGLPESDALDLERRLIVSIGLKGLTNLSRGEQSPASKSIEAAKEGLRHIAPYCRINEGVSPAHRAIPNREAIYWDIIGELSDLASSRKTPKFSSMAPQLRTGGLNAF